jgi:hypothetical protein
MFGMIVVTAIAMFIMTVSSGSIFNRTVEPQIEYSVSEVKKRSALTVTLNDYMWRVDGSGSVDNIEAGEYGNRSMKKVVSLFFTGVDSSTDITSGEVRFGRSTKPRSEVKADLEAYMQKQMDQFWRSEAVTTLSEDDGAGYSMELIHAGKRVRASSGDLEDLSTTTAYPIALPGGEQVSVVLRTSGAVQATGVNPSG